MICILFNIAEQEYIWNIYVEGSSFIKYSMSTYIFIVYLNQYL